MQVVKIELYGNKSIAVWSVYIYRLYKVQIDQEH